jgi:hypothetical protein
MFSNKSIAALLTAFTLGGCVTVGNPGGPIVTPAPPAATITEVSQPPAFSRRYIMCDGRFTGLRELRVLTSRLTFFQVNDPVTTVTTSTNPERPRNGLSLDCNARFARTDGTGTQVLSRSTARTRDGFFVSNVLWRQPGGLLVTLIDPDGATLGF